MGDAWSGYLLRTTIIRCTSGFLLAGMIQMMDRSRRAWWMSKGLHDPGILCAGQLVYNRRKSFTRRSGAHLGYQSDQQMGCARISRVVTTWRRILIKILLKTHAVPARLNARFRRSRWVLIDTSGRPYASCSIIILRTQQSAMLDRTLNRNDKLAVISFRTQPSF